MDAFDFGSKRSYSPIKAGRRAGIQQTASADLDNADELIASALKSFSNDQSDILNLDSLGESLPPKSAGGSSEEKVPPPPKSRRNAGWGDESSRVKTALGERLVIGNENDNKGNDSDEDSDSMPEIPDLDEVQAEETVHQVATAPSMSVNRVATYRELDNDLFKHAAFATIEDIDLRLLTKCMAPELELKEPDLTWNWDVLFTEVMSDLFPNTENNNEDWDNRPVTAGGSRPKTAINQPSRMK